MSEKKNNTEQTEKKPENIEVWEDVVNIKDLILSMVICSVFALGGYLIAPNEEPKPLIFGLIGVVVGFVISTIIVKPKRTLSYMEDEEK